MNDEKQLMTAAEDYVHLLCVMPDTISIPLSQAAIRASVKGMCRGCKVSLQDKWDYMLRQPHLGVQRMQHWLVTTCCVR